MDRLQAIYLVPMALVVTAFAVIGFWSFVRWISGNRFRVEGFRIIYSKRPPEAPNRGFEVITTPGTTPGRFEKKQDSGSD
jgi:hypothetical protein